MKKFVIVFLLLIVVQMINAQSNEELFNVLKERVEVAKVNQSIVVAEIDEKGTKFTSFGKTDQGSTNSNENTVFEIGSITKAFTGILLAEALKRGEVNLDDPISKHLPSTVKIPTRNNKEITLLDLATHTSGLPRLPSNFAPKDFQNPYADYTVQNMYDFLSSYELPRDIGEKYEYSNLGMGLLGHILSLKAKTNYENLVKTRILLPLELFDTTITLTPNQKERLAQGFDISGEKTPLWDLSTFAGSGALRSTAKDLAKFVKYLLNLEKSSLNDVFNESENVRFTVDPKTKLGLGWHILQSKPEQEIIWHNGGTGGFSSFLAFNKTEKRGVVVLSNSAQDADDIGLNILDKSNPLKKFNPDFAVEEKLLEEYSGRYELAPNVVFNISTEDGKLYAQITNQQRFRVFAESANKFYYKVVQAKLTFNRGADGTIESLTLIQNGEHIAKRLNNQLK